MASSIAIVTGATSGVGREFVRQLDAGAGGSIDEFWLVARSEAALAEVAAQTRHACRLFPLDLTCAESLATLETALEESNRAQVKWLVNSAGFGKFGRAWEIDREQTGNMVRLNCLAATALCSAAIAHMGPGSRIVNLASVAGLMPQPELSVYSATKRYVLDLTRTLAYELRGTGIHACALCPKFMDTRFLDRAGDEQAVRRMTSIGFEDVGRAVACGIRAAEKGRVTCIPSPDMRIANAAAKLLPSSVFLRAQDAFFTLAAGPSARRFFPDGA